MWHLKYLFSLSILLSTFSVSFSQITSYSNWNIKNSQIVEIKERKARYDSVWYERNMNWPDTTFEFHLLYDTSGNLIEQRWELSDDGSIYEAEAYKYDKYDHVIENKSVRTRKGSNISSPYWLLPESKCEFYQLDLLVSEQYRIGDDIVFKYYKYNGKLLDMVLTFKNGEIWSIDLIEYFYQE